MKIIASVDAENIRTFDAFKNTQLFKNLTGEELR